MGSLHPIGQHDDQIDQDVFAAENIEFFVELFVRLFAVLRFGAFLLVIRGVKGGQCQGSDQQQCHDDQHIEGPGWVCFFDSVSQNQKTTM